MQCHDLCEDENIQNCTSCHMPKSSTTDIMHVSITDHKIGLHSSNESKEVNSLGYLLLIITILLIYLKQRLT